MLVLGVVGLAVAALVNFLQSASEREGAGPPPAEQAPPAGTDRTDTGSALPGLLPEIVPLPGELRKAGGLLWWSGGACEARVLALGSGFITHLPRGSCRIWPEPHGRRVAVINPRGVEGGSGPDGGLTLLGYPAPKGERVLGGATAVRHSPGVVAAEVAWRQDGDRLAACAASEDGGTVAVDVFAASGQLEESIDGACLPAFLADGRLAVRRGAVSIELDGKPLAGDAAAKVLLPSVPDGATRFVTTLGTDGGRVAAGYAAIDPSRGVTSSAAIAVIGRRGALEFAAHLRPDTVPVALGFAPYGTAMWYYDSTSGVAVLLEVPGGRRLQPFGARWLAWSPDGDYLAAASDAGISVFTWPEERRVADIDAEADVVAWTEKP